MKRFCLLTLILVTTHIYYISAETISFDESGYLNGTFSEYLNETNIPDDVSIPSDVPAICRSCELSLAVGGIGILTSALLAKITSHKLPAMVLVLMSSALLFEWQNGGLTLISDHEEQKSELLLAKT